MANKITPLNVAGESFESYKKTSAGGNRHIAGEFLNAQQKKEFRSCWNTSRRVTFTRHQDLENGGNDGTAWNLSQFNQLLPIAQTFKNIGGFVAGGAVMSSLIGELDKVKDIDIFCIDSDLFVVYDGISLENGDQWTVNPEQKAQFLEDPEKCLYVEYLPCEGNKLFKKIQCIKMIWYQGVYDIIKSFDLSIVRMAIAGDHLIYDEEGLKDLKNRKMTVTGSYNAGSLIRRLVKYQKRGFSWYDEYTMDQLVEYINGDHIKKSGNPYAAADEPVMNPAYLAQNDKLAQYHGYENYAQMQKEQGWD